MWLLRRMIRISWRVNVTNNKRLEVTMKVEQYTQLQERVKHRALVILLEERHLRKCLQLEISTVEETQVDKEK